MDEGEGVLMRHLIKARTDITFSLFSNFHLFVLFVAIRKIVNNKELLK